MISTFQIATEKTLKKLIIIILLFPFSLTFSQSNPVLYNDNVYKTWHEFSNSDINMSYNNGTPIDLPAVFDSEINVPNHTSINPKAYAKLKVLTNGPQFNWFKTKIVLRLQYYLPDGSLDPNSFTTIPLAIEYNPNSNSANYIDISEHIVTNRYGLKAAVIDIITENIGGQTTHIANANINLEIGFECERYYLLSQQLPNVQSQILFDDNDLGASVASALNFQWNTIQGATEYELEWTWVDNYDSPDLNGNLATINPNRIKFSSRDFEINCTRIKTTKTEYEIPLIYSHGHIIYRVRAIGRFIDDVSKNYYGQWSSGSSAKNFVDDWTDKIEVPDHENEKNWQFQSSYAEEGKKKEVVSYFDGTLRNRQTVTKTNTNNTAVVGEVIYDNQGRAAIEILPVPLRKKNYLRYFSDLNKNTNDQVFTHYDFDWDISNTNCNISLTGMSSDHGASRYYSGNNDFDDRNIEFIPDAFNYPFSQIEYTPDNTGRIKRKGGVGFTHQLDSGHEMKYYYTTPYQEELNRLFGYSVGFVSHYKKNLVIDPNGQVSVSYIDPQGRTIATGLSGSTTNNLTALQEETSGNHENKTIDLFNNQSPQHLNTIADNNILLSTGTFQNHNDKLTLFKEVVVGGNNINHNFNYNISNNTIFTPEKCSTSYPFVYDLKLSLKNECLTELFTPYNSTSGPEYIRTIGNPSLNISPNPINPTNIDFTSLSLNTGSYTLIKELKINEVALNSFADDYINRLTDPDSSCLIQQSTFTSTSSSVDCSTDCAECLNNIGAQDIYVLSQLKSHYNNNTFTNLNLGNNSVSFQNSEHDYNEDGDIDNNEVIGLIESYKEEWQALKNGCDQFCGPTFSSSCAIDESSLLADMSPKGQYADDTIVNINTTVGGQEILGVSNVLSVFNDTNSLVYINNINNVPSIDTTQNDWRHPVTPYQDDLGIPSRIEVVLDENTTDPLDYSPRILSTVNPVASLINGQTVLTVLPQELANVEDFITTYWIPSWAQSLLPYHPEYCYLQYSKELCTKTKETAVLDNPSATSSTSRNLSTDEYDGYLEYINTYAAAVNAGFISSATGIIDPAAIYDKDPYFESQLSNSFESQGTFDSRKGIMLEAINNNYDGIGISMLLQSYRNVVCNSITQCNQNSVDISGLTNVQKDKLWNTYKNLYKSLKSKIKYVFINLYAKEHGCYNGCIGSDSPSSITNVINTYSQASAIYNVFYNSSYAGNQLCSNPTTINYNTKQKRFIPSDFGYNSGISPSAAVAELTAQVQYQQYAQTGNCPLLFDLEVLFDDYFKVIPSSGLNNFSQPITQALSLKLFEGLTGINFNPSNPPTSANFNTVLDTTNKTITFSLSGSGFTPSSSTVPQLSITIPNTAGYPNWSNFGTTWTITDFKQFYYDKNASNVTNLNALDFAFSAVIVYIDNTGTRKEMVVTGHTRAAIGECGVGNVIGQVLDNNTGSAAPSGCDTKYKFKEAIIGLLNQLNTSTVLYSSTPIQLNLYTSYTQTYLKDFFGETATITSTWKYELGTFSITKGGQTIFTMQVPTLPTSGINHFEGIAIGTPVTSFELFYTLVGGPLLISKTGNFNSSISFSCCDAQTNIVPTFTLRTQTNTNNGNMTTEDRSFIPVNISIPIGQVFELEFKINKDVNSTPNLESSYTTLISIDNVIRNFSTDFRTGTAGGLHLPPASRLSWDWRTNPSLGSRFDINFFEYKINDNALKAFLFDSNHNLISNDLTQTVLSTLSKSWNPYTTSNSSDFWATNNDWLSLGYGRQTIWNNLDSFKFKHSESLKLHFKAKLKFTDRLPYYNGNYGGNADYWGHIAQIDFQDENNSDILYQLLIGGQNQKSELCTTCIPQTVTPVSCDDKYNYYINQMGLQSGTSRFANITTINDTYSQEEFCQNNLGYIVDSYIQYLNLLNITSTEDTRYLTLIQFGDTDLHYGYNGINDVITAYNNYLIDYALQGNTTTNTEELQVPYNWKDFVNLNYIRNSATKICPPAAMQVSSLTITQSQTPCEEMSTSVTDTYLDDNYNNYIKSLREDFIKDYIEAAMAGVSEQFTMTYFDKEYQYTLYYYDQAGNLIKTVAPQGVNRIENVATNANINNYRNNINAATSISGDDLTLLPNHNFKTEYRYNSLNQLVWQSTPDGGVTKFAYDSLGRIIASQNANQAFSNNKMSYTIYDGLGRISEAGEITFELGLFSINDEGKLIKDTSVTDVFDTYIQKNQVTKTIYDVDPLVDTNPSIYASTLFITNSATSNPIFNNRNRVTGIFYYDNLSSNFDNAIFYNYDVHGNVKELINYYPYLKGGDCDLIINPNTGQKNDCEAHIKRVIYEYDLISGNVKQVVYQPNRPNQSIKKDMFIHKYEYDADNRIVNVQTSRDGIIWEKDANYYYYPHGPLSRTEIGDKKVQGLDYAYTLQGWLKMVNSENLTKPHIDMGKDGTDNVFNKDVFGYSLNYFDSVQNNSGNLISQNDYNAIKNDDGTNSFNPLQFSRDNAIQPGSKNLYNGNIKKMTTALRKDRDDLLPTQVNKYEYDQLNRIGSMTSSSINTTTNRKQESYSSNYSYDKNGNIQTLNRTKNDVITGAPIIMDKLRYFYNSTDNRLNIVHDGVPNNVDNNDIDDQLSFLANIPNNTNPNNYIYDRIGQLVEDRSEKINISWRVDGKVDKITNDKNHTGIKFQYDGLGNRIAKSVYNLIGDENLTTTYYSRDAQGNVMGVYTIKPNEAGYITQRINESHIYGSSRLGLESKEDLICKISNGTPRTSGNTMNNQAIIPVNTADLSKYSLSILPNNTMSWQEPIIENPNTLINDDFEIQTKFKLDSSLESQADGDIFIGKTEYSQNEHQTVTNLIVTPISMSQFEVSNNIQNIGYPIMVDGISKYYLPCVSGSSLVRVNGYGSSGRTKIECSIKKNGYIEANFSSGFSMGLSYSTDTFGNDPASMRYKLASSTTNNGVQTFINFQTTVSGSRANCSTHAKIRIKRNNGIISFWYVENSTETQIGSSYVEPTTYNDVPLVGLINFTSEMAMSPIMVEYNVTNNEVAANINATSQFTQTSNLSYNSTENCFSTSSTTSVFTSTPLPVIVGDGYIERTLTFSDATTSTMLRATSFGFSFNNSLGSSIDFCSVIPDGASTSLDFKQNVLPSSNGTGTVRTTNCVTSVQNGDRLRIERKNGKINYYIFYSQGGGRLLGTITLTASQSVAPLYLKIIMTGTSAHTASIRKIHNLKIVNYKTAFKTTEAKLFVNKSGGTYTPKLVIAKEGFDYSSTIVGGVYKKTTKTFSLPPITAVSFQSMREKGMELKFNTLTAGTGEFIVDNATPITAITTPSSITSSATQTNIDTASQIGPGSFDICYLNYKFGNSNAVTSTFDFTNNSIANPILTNGEPTITAYNGTAILPSVIKTFGPCLLDTDSDGIYDVFETPNDTVILTNNDTDLDGIPNYLDPDDDGDTILTKFEGVNLYGSQNPNTSILLLDTDGDLIPNYLDVDDDNDGYATWETIETDNITDNDGNPTTHPLDSDNDTIVNHLDAIDNNPAPVQSVALSDYYNVVGDKSYELSNHLGNVLEVINDKKIPELDANGNLLYFNSDILSYSDYYPFGSLLPDRHGSSEKYRYGFQGQEKDDEIKGEGNSLNYTFRMHDPRVGRFFAMDPMTHQYPWYSPYQFSGNKVIQFVELEGLEEGLPMLPDDGNPFVDIFIQAEDGFRNTISLPLIRAIQSDEAEGKQVRYALSQLGYDKELYGKISNKDLASNFDIRAYGGYKDVFPEKGVGEQLLTFVGDALDVASIMPTKNGVFLAIKTGLGANSVTSILRGLKISSRTAEILQTFKDVGGQGAFRKIEAEGMAIFEETFKTTVRALDNIKDFKKAGDFIVISGKFAGKSVDLVSAVNNKNFNTKKFIDSIDAHYNKDGVDLINIDIRALGNEAKEIVKKHIGGLSKENKARTILTE